MKKKTEQLDLRSEIPLYITHLNDFIFYYIQQHNTCTQCTSSQFVNNSQNVISHLTMNKGDNALSFLL